MQKLESFLSKDPLFSLLPPKLQKNLGEQSSYLIVPKGKPLILQGEKEERFFLVVSGKFLVYKEDNKGALLGELIPHDTAGGLSLISEEKSLVSIIAGKDSSVLSFPKTSFATLLQYTFPLLLEKIAKKIDMHVREPNACSKKQKFCFIPINSSKEEFSFFLKQLLQEVPLPYLHVKPSDFQEKKIPSLEEETKLIFFEGEPHPTPFTKWCMEEADQTFLVINPHIPHSFHHIEPFTPRHASSLLMDAIIFLHPPGTEPSQTARWLDIYPTQKYHHVFLQEIESYQHLYRILMGKGVNLVLGGGGARSFAHIGILKAMKECSFPIDRIGGSSLGAFFGALHALDFNVEDITKEIFSHLMFFLDYTLPTTSLIQGKKIFSYLQDTFRALNIEDIPIPFFSVSSDMNTLQPYLHTKGRIDTAILASCSLPGIFPPVDKDGLFHIDGSIANILPLDLMEGFAKDGLIVGIDVERQQEPKNKEPFPPYFSLCQHFLYKITGKKSPFPNIFETLIYSTFVHTTSRKEELLSQKLASLYIAPPLKEFSSLQYKSFEKISHKGYTWAMEHMNEWKKTINDTP